MNKKPEWMMTRNKSNETSIKPLSDAILKLHGCQSRWEKSVPVLETFQGQTVWEGTVEVFKLIDHPTAKKCYAWSYELKGTKKRKYVAVLHDGPVKSPVDAVRAFIASEYK